MTIITNKNIQYNQVDLQFINKVLSNSSKNNIFNLLNGTKNKFKIINNWAGESKDLPVGSIIEIYNEDDKLILQTARNK